MQPFRSYRVNPRFYEVCFVLLNLWLVFVVSTNVCPFSFGHCIVLRITVSDYPLCSNFSYGYLKNQHSELYFI